MTAKVPAKESGPGSRPANRLDATDTGQSLVVRDTDSDTSRSIIVRLSLSTHRSLRVRVAEEDTSIQKWVVALIERELSIRPD